MAKHRYGAKADDGRAYKDLGEETARQANLAAVVRMRRGDQIALFRGSPGDAEFVGLCRVTRRLGVRVWYKKDDDSPEQEIPNSGAFVLKLSVLQNWERRHGVSLSPGTAIRR